MNNKICIREIEPLKAAVKRFKGPLNEAAGFFPAVFKAISGRSNGAPFFSYYSLDPQSSICDLEICVPTAEAPQAAGIFLKEFPGAKALCLTHTGPYSSLPKAYESLQTYIHQNNLKTGLPWREVYIKGPGMFLKGNPQKYITEIVFPLEQD